MATPPKSQSSWLLADGSSGKGFFPKNCCEPSPTQHHLVGGLEHECYFSYIGNNHPNWLIFFRGVETTNQSSVQFSFDNLTWWSFPGRLDQISGKLDTTTITSHDVAHWTGGTMACSPPSWPHNSDWKAPPCANTFSLTPNLCVVLDLQNLVQYQNQRDSQMVGPVFPCRADW